MLNPLDEVRYIQIYRELTGASEAQARSSFIFACCAEDALSVGAQEHVVPCRADPIWEEEFLNEPATESRSLSHVHQLAGAAHEGYA